MHRPPTFDVDKPERVAIAVHLVFAVSFEHQQTYVPHHSSAPDRRGLRDCGRPTLDMIVVLGLKNSAAS
jgi:hypothetical protein